MIKDASARLERNYDILRSQFVQYLAIWLCGTVWLRVALRLEI